MSNVRRDLCLCLCRLSSADTCVGAAAARWACWARAMARLGVTDGASAHARAMGRTRHMERVTCRVICSTRASLMKWTRGVRASTSVSGWHLSCYGVCCAVLGLAMNPVHMACAALVCCRHTLAFPRTPPCMVCCIVRLLRREHIRAFSPVARVCAAQSSNRLTGTAGLIADMTSRDLPQVCL